MRAEGPLQLLQIFETIDRTFGDLIKDKSVSTVVQLCCFTPALAHAGTGARKKFEYVATAERVELSELDRKIVEFIRDKPLATLQEIGRAVSASASSVAYRFNRLVTSGAILGFGYGFDTTNSPETEFLVSLSTTGFGALCYDRIASFCAETPEVLWLGRSIGHWDIQLAISVSRAADLETFVERLNAICRDEVNEMHIHTFSKLYRER